MSASRIDASAKCELRSAICFLQAEGNSAAEIHRLMRRIYGENVLSDGFVHEWCNKLKTGEPTFMTNRDKDGSPSKQKILFNEFPAASGAV
ncbi:hypothetical protein AVEN_234222-1 [Araneus ventricosus]|uniref:Mos1 transposase HTH domain-containing protein n=1 Tax=Araneus ventricosus TaxID=182803 RepID=A0A4Y2A9F5_ARAVE|nr:hypothetical protein AVEN_234222-1 [Araneus ventricosus]